MAVSSPEEGQEPVPGVDVLAVVYLQAEPSVSLEAVVLDVLAVVCLREPFVSLESCAGEVAVPLPEVAGAQEPALGVDVPEPGEA